MPRTINPWAPFAATSGEAWDLRNIAHLHRRAGYGATWSELQRDLRAGPAASVDRLLNPPPPSADEQQVLDSLRHICRCYGWQPADHPIQFPRRNIRNLFARR